MRALLAGLWGLFLSICMLFGSWGPVFWQLDVARWAELTLAAVVGVAAGALASRETPAWLAWIILVVLAWAAYLWAAFYLLPAPMPQFIVYPLAASVGVATGLAARRVSSSPLRRSIPIVLCIAAVIGIFFLHGPLAALGQPDRWRPPPFTLHLANGTQVSSQSLLGKTVVLSFWATWCGPCREELPALQRLYAAHYADRDAVRFFLVSEDHGPGSIAKAAAWLKDHGVTMPAAMDPGGALSRTLRTASVLPVRVLIGPGGKLRLSTFGYFKENAGFPALRAAIAKSSGD